MQQQHLTVLNHDIQWCLGVLACSVMQVFHFSESKEKDDQDAQENSKANAQSDVVDAKPSTPSKKIS